MVKRLWNVSEIILYGFKTTDADTNKLLLISLLLFVFILLALFDVILFSLKYQQFLTFLFRINYTS